MKAMILVSTCEVPECLCVNDKSHTLHFKNLCGFIMERTPSSQNTQRFGDTISAVLMTHFKLPRQRLGKTALAVAALSWRLEVSPLPWWTQSSWKQPGTAASCSVWTPRPDINSSGRAKCRGIFSLASNTFSSTLATWIYSNQLTPIDEFQIGIGYTSI